jgi:hypothetical protein
MTGGSTMAGSNELVVSNYLETMSAMGASGNVADFFAFEVVIQEFKGCV